MSITFARKYNAIPKSLISTNKPANFISNSKQPESSFFPPAIIQPKLAIGQVNDSYEKEADSIANKAISTSTQHNSLVSQISPLNTSATQRKTTSTNGGNSNPKSLMASSQLESKINTSKGGGSAMDTDTQTEMSQKFGTNFGDVRIHTDQSSIQMNRQLGAKAFTVGNDIYFNQGQYSPNNQQGKHLLAHELTHVVQQRGIQQIQRTPDFDGGTAGLHEDLTRQYSQETGVPYRPGLQYTEGYRLWLASKNDVDTKKTPKTPDFHAGTIGLHKDLTTQYSRETGVPYRLGLQYTEGYRAWITSDNDAETKETPKETSSEHATKEKEQKKKLKTVINAAAGTKTDKKGTSLAASADAKLKIPLGGPFLDYFKFAIKTGPFIKWQQSLESPAKEKFEAGLKFQLDMLDFLVKQNNFSLTMGPYLAGSGGFKTEDDKRKPFGSMNLGVTGNFIYTGNIWEANIYLTGGYSLYGTKDKKPKSGAFIDTGASIYLRGNVGSKEHKVLLGPVLGGGYIGDSSQGKSEGYFNLGIRGMF
ncbi:DUF4157 domain-containing protein [Aureisphaera galaxeae]|uniref:eCIS core domain-containing protein n=1 Tax=Aureisphaera galaxeae TaxID=1538023 RepID=UPI00234FC514|nr:DUF4157 domain-containing protein [Aureisphaera galaxeae]MDC8004946.1 DUF4157 domain-containing protein [Aureisphaera galaxeae]